MFILRSSIKFHFALKHFLQTIAASPRWRLAADVGIHSFDEQKRISEWNAKKALQGFLKYEFLKSHLQVEPGTFDEAHGSIAIFVVYWFS